MTERDNQMDSIGARILNLKARHEAGETLSVRELDWVMGTLALQHTVVVSGEALIEAQQVALLNKDIEIFNLKGVPLAHRSKND